MGKKINIDGKEYDTDHMSGEAKNALGALQFTEAEIQRLQAKLAAMQTARMVYANGLKQALDKAPQATQAIDEKPFGFSSETVKFK